MEEYKRNGKKEKEERGKRKEGTGFVQLYQIKIQGLFNVQGLKITEVQGSAILTHIFTLYKAHVTAQETATCSTETALGRPPHIILRFKNKAALLGEIVK